MQECLQHFEDIVYASTNDINQAWPRFLPIRLSPEHRSWYSDNLAHQTHLSWHAARTLYEGEFVVDDSELVARNVDKFMSCRQTKKETISEFTARFQKLRRDARQPDDQVAVNRYLNGLHSHIADRVNTARASQSQHEKRTVQQVSQLALTLENSYGQQHSSNHSNGDNVSSSSGSRDKSSFSRKRRAVSPSVGENQKKFCQIHGKGNHSTEECRKRQQVLKQETVPNKLSTDGESSRGGGSFVSSGAGGSGKHVRNKGKGRHFVACAHSHAKDKKPASTSSVKHKAVTTAPNKSHALQVSSPSGETTPGVDSSAISSSSVAAPVSGGDCSSSGSSV